MEKWGVAYDTGNIGPGDIKFKDLNGDGRINDEDMTSIGNLGQHTYMDSM